MSGAAASIDEALLDLAAVEHGALSHAARARILGISTEALEEAFARLRTRGLFDAAGRLPLEVRAERLRALRDRRALAPLRAAVEASSSRTDLRALGVALLVGDASEVKRLLPMFGPGYASTPDAPPEILALGDAPSMRTYGLVDPRTRPFYAEGAAAWSVEKLSDDSVARAALGAPEEPLAEATPRARALRALRALFEGGASAAPAFDVVPAVTATAVVDRLLRWIAGDAAARVELARTTLGPERCVPLRFFVGLARLASAGFPLHRDQGLPRGVDEALRFGARLRDDEVVSAQGWLARDEAFWSIFAYALIHAAFVPDVALRRRAAESLPRAIDAAAHVPWLAHEASELFDLLHGSRAAKSAFVPLVEVEAPWRRKLRRLHAVIGDRAPTSGAEVRFSWALELAADGTILGVALREQRATRAGWSRGRALKLARAVRTALPPETPDEDRRLFAALSPDKRPGARFLPAADVWIDDARFAEALVGHPRIARAGEEGFSPVRRGRARLAVREGEDDFTLAIEPRRSGVLARGGALEAVVLDARQAEAADAVNGVFVVPLEARGEVERLVAALAPLFTVDASADLSLESVEEVPADATPRVRLRRDVGLVGFEVVVTPLGPEGPAWVAGEGHDVVIARGRRATRDRRAEVHAQRALFAACPALRGRTRGTCGIEDALELLAELRDAGACVEWREGTPLHVAPAQGTLALRVAQRDDWLVGSGGLEVDGALVATFEALLDAVRRERRFVPLDDDRYLELTASLRRSLERVEAFTEGEVLHPLVALVDEPELELRGLEVERERLRAAMEEPVQVPRTLEASLRGYQVEGFTWMARLARAGLGACLADDMGLGKTVQTLALLLERAAEGPALVVAPTSVLAGWREEAMRFAPSLRMHVIGAGVGKDEAEAKVREAGAFDVLLTSYGLLASRAALFTSRAWTTAVLDEAQAIKNDATQTARAAHRLRADARIALSGTPVENHLGELWSLFRFLVPGLLGTKRSFRGNFVKGVADVEGHAFAPGYPGRRLRERVRPFVLRRDKREVLRELPPRTEVVLRVEPSPAQRAFLEALRRKDVRGLEDAKDARFALLAALMRQRRACCAPALVAPGTKLGSAKLDAFFALVDELREGGHRALVFSQFVDLLSLVRAGLDERGVAYRYLDGSTTPKQREREVAAFQGGEGDLFLISLKAGGTGLNLTAADYVVHLDPWWNPAAEDQASDRAHRLGQTRPVTIYRLVLEGSVEEKILALHERKRGLAEGLLADAHDADVRVDLETLERLLRD